jgi:hypothetical protein
MNFCPRANISIRVNCQLESASYEMGKLHAVQLGAQTSLPSRSRPHRVRSTQASLLKYFLIEPVRIACDSLDASMLA